MRRRNETFSERVWRYRGVVAVALVPVFLVLAILLLMPRTPPLDGGVSYVGNAVSADRYAVVFDAGSTGSRVHVFHFARGGDGAMTLLKDTFEQLKPGLSAYAGDPAAAAASLQPLLDTALTTIPAAAHASSRVELRATAGLRLLPGAQADDILAAVRTLLASSGLPTDDGCVSILDGEDEGAFAWLTLNYLLGTLHSGRGVSGTVAAIDMGGGSIQEAYAVDATAAAAAPPGYVKTLAAFGSDVHVYSHSYLGFGLMAGRAAVLGAPSGGACVLPGSQGAFEYGGAALPLVSDPSVGHTACEAAVTAALQPGAGCGVPEVLECTFQGAWGGRRADAPGLARGHYVSSYVWDRAVESGVVTDADAVQWETSAAEIAGKAAAACGLGGVGEVAAAFGGVEEAGRPYLCLDLTFAHTILTQGFRLDPEARITLVKQVEYNGERIEAAWPLGAAINSMG